MTIHEMDLVRRSKGFHDFTRSAIDVGIEKAGTLDSSRHPDFRVSATAFLETLRPISAFERIRSLSMQIPWFGNFRAASGFTEITERNEGVAMIQATFSFPAENLTRKQAGGLLVVTRDFLREGAPGTQDFIGQELRLATAKAIDTLFITPLLSGATAVPSTGDMKTSIEALIEAVTLHQGQRLVWIGDANTAAKLGVELVFSGHSGGLPIDPSGTFMNRPFIISDLLPITSPASGFLVLADASQIITSDQGVQLDRSEQAALEMSADAVHAASGVNSPASSQAAELVSLWQTNAVALRCLRRFAYGIPRPAAVAKMDGINW